MTGNYDSTGTVVIGYTLFALSLAVALGAIWRRERSGPKTTSSISAPIGPSRC